MAHGGDDRNLRGIDGTGYVLVVEGPEILHGAAAPSGNQQVGHPMPVGPGDGRAKLPRGLRPLYPHRQHQHLRQRPAGPQYAEHIPHRRPRWGGNEGDFSGIARDGLLVGRVEQPLLVELLLELFKGHMEVPHAVGCQLTTVELILPVP